MEPIFDIRVEVDGAYKLIGENPLGAAVAVITTVNGTITKTKQHSVIIPPDEEPTPERAELTALVVALRHTIAAWDAQYRDHIQTEPFLLPRLRLDIYSHSNYAPILNTDRTLLLPSDPYRDLTLIVLDLHRHVKGLGTVKYTRVAEAQSTRSDRGCGEAIALFEKGGWDGPLSSEYEYPGIVLAGGIELSSGKIV